MSTPVSAPPLKPQRTEPFTWLPQPSPAQRAWLKRVCTEALARRFAP
jgi:hypothetical protein